MMQNLEPNLQKFNRFTRKVENNFLMTNALLFNISRMNLDSQG